MNCDVSWKFSAPLKLVDVNRILKEAGPYAKCVRFSIDGKVYTAVNSKKVGVLPDPNKNYKCDGYSVTDFAPSERDSNGDVLLNFFSDHPFTTWRIYRDDRTKEIVDRVKVSVEVYK